MQISRRKMLKTGALSALFAGFSLCSVNEVLGQNKKKSISGKDTPEVHQIPHQPKLDKKFYFTENTFRPYIDGTFTIQDDLGTPFEMTLISVSDLRTEAQKRAGGGESFALTFTADAGDDVQKYALRQRIYHVEHGALGKFELFLVPSEKDGKVFYEAVINHAVK